MFLNAFKVALVNWVGTAQTKLLKSLADARSARLAAFRCGFNLISGEKSSLCGHY